MKRLSLCLLLVVFVVSLLAVESEPSEIVGYVAYQCIAVGFGAEQEGNNMIALPMETGYINASDLGSAYPNQIDVISRWVAPDQGWDAASFVDGIWYGNYELEGGHAYMVNVTEAVTIYSVGAIVPPAVYELILVTDDITQEVIGGNNLLMVPLNRSDLVTASDLGSDVGVVDVVSRWIAADQGWDAASFVGGVWYGNYAVSIADPLMVNVTEDAVWPAPGRTSATRR